MNATSNTNAPMEGAPTRPPRQPQRPRILQLPGLVAIAVYMLMLAGSAIVAVAHGNSHPVYLIFSALFIAGALGLLMLFRWAWALTLAAVAMLAGLSLWSFSSQHSFAALVQGLLNLVIFLYLVRTSIRAKLR
ncbi:MAG: hypothetical protein WBC92_09835 [Terracidiphilus sp.]